MKRFTFTVSTEGNTDIVNLSPELARRCAEVKGDGLLHIFVGGSTASITTLEFEPGLVKHDLPRILQRELPNFMQPQRIHWREALPIGPNGKIDRTGLQASLAA